MTTPAPKKDFRVAIVGGGMCGLACAVVLRRRGIDAQVFEAAAKFDSVGAGVSLGPNALRALKCLGLLETVLGLVNANDGGGEMLFVSGSGAHELIHQYKSDTGIKDVTGVYRPAFLAAVVSLVDPHAVHFNKRFTNLSTSASGAHTLHFADGTRHETDVIIGADGIKSALRSPVLGSGERVVQYTNCVAYRGMVPADTLRLAGVKAGLGKDTYCFVGLDKHLIYFPINAGKLINVVAFVTDKSVPVGSVEIPGPWVESASEAELVDAFAEWGPDVRTILDHCKSTSKWYIHALRPLNTFVNGSIALVGDAAHAMPPYLGAGVGQGFEDVFVLCELLAHPKTSLANVTDVFRAYDAVRRPRANMALARSIHAGELYEVYGTPGYAAADMEAHLRDIWDPIWRHDLDAELASAVASLRVNGSF
ncbi:FAD/NAD(P)-binding domain-containing protein [Mycena vulgaris]|nr:FAD/NAD(P)-binding domain-containing protein [Mycena vulgaris]